MDTIALLLTEAYLSLKGFQVSEFSCPQTLVKETIEPLNATIAPRFSGWIEDRLNIQVDSDTDKPAKGTRIAIRTAKL